MGDLDLDDTGPAGLRPADTSENAYHGPVPGPVTLSQVAREAGVSISTASRAVNGSADRTVRQDLIDRVMIAAERLRYVPNANAQAMARGKTTALGLIVHDIADPYFSSIAAGVTIAAERADLAVTLASTQHDPSREPRFVEVLTSQRAQAIVIAGGRHDDETDERLLLALEGFRKTGGSVALIGQALPGVNAVVLKNRSGAAALARALHELGYRRFAVLAGPANHRTAEDRRKGFTDALRELGVQVDPAAVITTGFTRDGGYEGMASLLRGGPVAEVVFAVNDVMAVGAMAAARDQGVRVPDDIAVAGFDDIDTLRDITPALTTVRVPLVEVGISAAELAIEDSGVTPHLKQVACEVVLRESTPRRP